MTQVIKNGEVWKQPQFPFCSYVIQWITDDQWLLMSMPYMSRHGWVASMPSSGGMGKIIFSEAEAIRTLNKHGFEPQGDGVEGLDYTGNG